MTVPDRNAARALWYYYVAQLTQQDIADRLGLTRLRVNQIVGAARRDGSVRVELAIPLLDCVALEDRLRASYGLADVTVVPSIKDYLDTQRTVGEAAASMLDRNIAVTQGGIGVGWGRTLSKAVAHLRNRPAGERWVVSLMGGLTRGSGSNTFEVSTRLAEHLGAECWYLAAPIFCPNEHTRAALLEHAGLADVLRRAREVSIALVACGDLSKRSHLATTASVRDQIETLHEAGAVGDLLGTFLDANGQEVDHPLNRRVVALPPQALAGIATTILAAGGANKAPIMRAILATGLINRLVTDEECAKAVLAYDNQRQAGGRE